MMDLGTCRILVMSIAFMFLMINFQIIVYIMVRKHNLHNKYKKYLNSIRHSGSHRRIKIRGKSFHWVRLFVFNTYLCYIWINCSYGTLVDFNNWSKTNNVIWMCNAYVSKKNLMLPTECSCYCIIGYL